MTHVLIGGLAALALLAQAQTSRPSVFSTRPYSGLFVALPAKSLATPTVPVVVRRQTHSVAQSRAQIERGPCNMPIIVATPEIDPKIVRTIPRDRTEAKIRVIEPSPCGTKHEPR
jgi:hypothetical protein